MSESSLKKQVWKQVSRFVRLEDALKHKGRCICYTCGASLDPKRAQAGHGVGGRHNYLLYDLRIIKVQCLRCNIFLHGNYPVFAVKLIQEHGLKFYKNMLKYKVKKFSPQELRIMKETYKEKADQLEFING